MAYRTTYHRDGTVTVWDVYQAAWVRTSTPTDQLLATLDADERERVKRHVSGRLIAQARAQGRRKTRAVSIFLAHR